ncbi:transcription/translation regulatory transformer protein RfaH [Denitratisoma sp. agr-D3]
MHWYLIHTKPRQEKVALQNLKQQGYPCYLPVLPSEKLRQGALALNEEPLFPRYLFIQLGMESDDKSWTPIRSTKGVSRLVSFGSKPAKVPDNLIAFLQAQEATLQGKPERLFATGQRVCLTQGAFAGVEGIYQMADGERRVMVLIELMSKPVIISVAPTELRKVT